MMQRWRKRLVGALVAFVLVFLGILACRSVSDEEGPDTTESGDHERSSGVEMRVELVRTTQPIQVIGPELIDAGAV